MNEILAYRMKFQIQMASDILQFLDMYVKILSLEKNKGDIVHP